MPQNYIPLTVDLQGNYYVKRRDNPYHRYFNDFLALINICLGIYIIFSPIVPDLIYKATPQNKPQKLYQGRLAQEFISGTNIKPKNENFVQSIVENFTPELSEANLPPIPQENTLLIPKIGSDGLVHEGTSSDTLQKGFWRRANSSTPDKGGNTVIVAHRFLYTSGSNTFYNLDKMEIGDKFAVFWEGIEYNYQVYDIAVVPPTATEIEADTLEPIITLYTCTPLWTSKERLVVRARLI